MLLTRPMTEEDSLQSEVLVDHIIMQVYIKPEHLWLPLMPFNESLGSV